MRTQLLKLSGIAAALMFTAAGSAMAATAPTRASVEARYQQDRAACVAGHTAEDQATCLKEAGAARNERLAGIDLTEGSPDYRQNQLERCKIFTEPADARECRLRIEQGNVSGSVRDGGILRELTTVHQTGPAVVIVPVPAPAPMPAPAP
jgi:glutamine cyclotransferase